MANTSRLGRGGGGGNYFVQLHNITKQEMKVLLEKCVSIEVAEKA